jgi:hypothetical protein
MNSHLNAEISSIVLNCRQEAVSSQPGSIGIEGSEEDAVAFRRLTQ